MKTDTWRRYPELAEVLNLLHDQLNDRDMARFEQQVEEQEQFVRDVAETFLIEKGLL